MMNEKQIYIEKIGLTEKEADLYMNGQASNDLIFRVLESPWGFSEKFGLLNFSDCEEEYFTKNKNLFFCLNRERGVKYETRSDNKKDIWYDLLWIRDECIPVPVFLEIIGKRWELKSVLDVVDFLKEFVGVEVLTPRNIMPLEIEGDYEAIKVWVRKEPHNNLERATKEVRDDKEFILELLEDGHTFSVPDLVFSERLMGDKDVALKLIKTGHFLSSLSKEMRDNEDVVSLAVEKGETMGYAGPSVWRNEELVMRAFQNEGGGRLYTHHLFPEKFRTPKNFFTALKNMGKTDHLKKLKKWEEMIGEFFIWDEMRGELEDFFLQNSPSTLFSFSAKGEKSKVHVYKNGDLVINKNGWAVFIDKKNKLVPPRFMVTGEFIQTLGSEEMSDYHKLICFGSIVSEVSSGEKDFCYPHREGSRNVGFSQETFCEKEGRFQVVITHNFNWNSPRRELEIKGSALDYIKENASQIWAIYWQSPKTKISIFDTLV